MRRNAASLLALVAFFAGSSAPAAYAQGRDRGLVELPRRPVRGGFYFTAALGAGREQCRFQTIACAVLDANGVPFPDNGHKWRDAITSPAFALRLGGTPSPNVRLGAELLGWSGDNGPATERTAGLLATAQLYPSRRAGFYVKGGLGYGWSTFDDHVHATSTESGFMFNGGAGYDIPLSRSVAVAPFIDFYQGQYPHLGDETITERIMFVGLSITAQSSGRRWR